MVHKAKATRGRRVTDAQLKAGLDLHERHLWEQVIRKHALEHYEQEGWDFVVECLDRDEMLNMIWESEAKTLWEAFVEVRDWARLQSERRADARAAAGYEPL